MSTPTPQDYQVAAGGGRPAEKRGEIHFAAKDAGLRKDVHDLGVVVGQLLMEQGGAALFDRVEAARRAAIDRREDAAEGGRRLEQLVAGLTAPEARDFIRGFSTYFQAVNAAELVHRIRRRRDYLKEGLHRQPGGIEDALFLLRDAGVTLDEMRTLIGRLAFVPVLTAHPTEPTRRTLLRRQQDIVRRLIDMQNASLSPREVAADLNSIRDDLTVIWQTEEHPTGVRTVTDEREHVLFFLTDVIYRVAPAFYESFETALEEVYGPAAKTIDLPVMFRFASWIGGDMVGRNEITARTIRETLSRQRSLVLDLYLRECRLLADKLSQSTTRVGVVPELLDRIRLYTGHFPNTRGVIPARHRDMPYRVFMRLVMSRLQSTSTDGLYPYESAREFAADIDLVAASLAAHKGASAGLFAIRRLRRRIDTFGFHFVTLDIRQEAIENRRVLGRCLGESDWLNQTAAARAERLRRALTTNESPVADLDNEGKRAVGIFQGVTFCRRRFGNQAIGPYVISQAEGVDDVLTVLLLAEWGELRRRSGAVPLDIAPSCETAASLSGAPALLAALLAEPVYREHLEGRGNRQTVLIGIADGNVDTDLASGRWALRQTQRELVDVAGRHGIDLTVFHGRGGAISPGGGKAHVDVLAAPPGTVRGEVRAIEQGELVATKYGVRAIALRTIEQALGAIARATTRPAEAGSAIRPEWEQAAATVAAAAREFYQALVLESPGFSDYYRLATPADVLERMRRGGGQEMAGTEGLLASAGTAPWVFAWTQSRNILPGWFGFGHGLARAIEQFGTQTIQEMVAGWYFFRTLVVDVEAALAKSDLDIASRYSTLGGELHERFFPRIRAEFDLTVAMVLQARRQNVLLENDNTLRRSIRLRNPYVDPMSLLQVDLLRRWRESGDETVFDALIASVNGIARGLQDSG